MPSLFEPISKNLVKELGDKDLRPVKYLLSTNKFRQLALLWKKKGTHAQFWGQPAVPVEYTLMDILEPSSSVPDILFISDDDKWKTFPEEEYGNPLAKIFKHLQKEVSREMEAIAQLPKDTQDAVLRNILARLKDREALQDLMDVLDRGPSDHLDSFGGTFLSEMQEDSRNLRLKLRLHIISLPKAILGLSDTQHELLAWSMEKRILLQQRALVKSILEPNFKYPWNITFTLDPKLLTLLQVEGLAVTFSLLEECSLRVAPDSPKAT
ncbi:gasdermin-C [Phocoena sinus]|uniref:gasdermin-C n=1 Tax=Phocoena sinus TaxID=42100 RepID=UPI0013C4BD15|nr:gasdermin-C [Phocoena sinus]